MEISHRTTINLPLKLWRRLGVRAKRDRITQGEANRRAIWLFLESRDRQEQGWEVIWRNPTTSEEQRVLLEVAAEEVSIPLATG
jgi:hypothetical protein